MSQKRNSSQQTINKQKKTSRPSQNIIGYQSPSKRQQLPGAFTQQHEVNSRSIDFGKDQYGHQNQLIIQQNSKKKIIHLQGSFKRNTQQSALAKQHQQKQNQSSQSNIYPNIQQKSNRYYRNSQKYQMDSNQQAAKIKQNPSLQDGQDQQLLDQLCDKVSEMHENKKLQKVVYPKLSWNQIPSNSFDIANQQNNTPEKPPYDTKVPPQQYSSSLNDEQTFNTPIEQQPHRSEQQYIPDDTQRRLTDYYKQMNEKSKNKQYQQYKVIVKQPSPQKQSRPQDSFRKNNDIYGIQDKLISQQEQANEPLEIEVSVFQSIGEENPSFKQQDQRQNQQFKQGRQPQNPQLSQHKSQQQQRQRQALNLVERFQQAIQNSSQNNPSQNPSIQTAAPSNYNTHQSTAANIDNRFQSDGNNIMNQIIQVHSNIRRPEQNSFNIANQRMYQSQRKQQNSNQVRFFYNDKKDIIYTQECYRQPLSGENKKAIISIDPLVQYVPVRLQVEQIYKSPQSQGQGYKTPQNQRAPPINTRSKRQKKKDSDNSNVNQIPTIERRKSHRPVQTIFYRRQDQLRAILNHFNLKEQFVQSDETIKVKPITNFQTIQEDSIPVKIYISQQYKPQNQMMRSRNSISQKQETHPPISIVTDFRQQNQITTQYQRQIVNLRFRKSGNNIADSTKQDKSLQQRKSHKLQQKNQQSPKQQPERNQQQQSSYRNNQGNIEFDEKISEQKYRSQERPNLQSLNLIEYNENSYGNDQQTKLIRKPVLQEPVINNQFDISVDIGVQIKPTDNIRLITVPQQKFQTNQQQKEQHKSSKRGKKKTNTKKQFKKGTTNKKLEKSARQQKLQQKQELNKDNDSQQPSKISSVNSQKSSKNKPVLRNKRPQSKSKSQNQSETKSVKFDSEPTGSVFHFELIPKKQTDSMILVQVRRSGRLYSKSKAKQSRNLQEVQQQSDDQKINSRQKNQNVNSSLQKKSKKSQNKSKDRRQSVNNTPSRGNNPGSKRSAQSNQVDVEWLKQHISQIRQIKFEDTLLYDDFKAMTKNDAELNKFLLSLQQNHQKIEKQENRRLSQKSQKRGNKPQSNNKQFQILRKIKQSGRKSVSNRQSSKSKQKRGLQTQKNEQIRNKPKSDNKNKKITQNNRKRNRMTEGTEGSHISYTDAIQNKTAHQQMEMTQAEYGPYDEYHHQEKRGNISEDSRIVRQKVFNQNKQKYKIPVNLPLTISQIVDPDILDLGIYALVKLGPLTQFQLGTRYAITPICELKYARKSHVKLVIQQSVKMVPSYFKDNIALIALNSTLLELIQKASEEKKRKKYSQQKQLSQKKIQFQRQ